MVRLHPNQIVYFNQLFAGGVDTAWKRYETDYWRHAQKQALGWISRTYTSEYDRTIRVASRFTGIRHQMPEKLQLVDFRSSPDFYVGSTRYDEHRVIPGEVLHIIRAGRDAELAYVVRPDDSYVNEPFFTNSTFADVHRRPIYLREAECLESRGDRLGAARAYLKLSRCCERLSLKLLDQGMAPAGYAKKALGYQIKAISLIPSAEDAEKIENRYLGKGDYPGARDILQGLTATYPGQFRYVEKLIRTLAQTGEYDHALERCERWIRKDPKSLSPKLLRVTVSIASGDLDRAEGYLEEAERVSPGSEDVKTVRAALERAVQGASDLD
jgi:tetratricopeptide (TPR) repeat protein